MFLQRSYRRNTKKGGKQARKKNLEWQERRKHEKREIEQQMTQVLLNAVNNSCTLGTHLTGKWQLLYLMLGAAGTSQIRNLIQSRSKEKDTKELDRKTRWDTHTHTSQSPRQISAGANITDANRNNRRASWILTVMRSLMLFVLMRKMKKNALNWFVGWWKWIKLIFNLKQLFWILIISVIIRCCCHLWFTLYHYSILLCIYLRNSDHPTQNCRTRGAVVFYINRNGWEGQRPRQYEQKHCTNRHLS